jgi:hypothetical protein
MIDKVKDFWVYFASLPPYRALVLLMGGIITAFSFYYWHNEKAKDKEIELMKQQIADCSIVGKQLDELKNEFILLKATQDYLPIPFWIKSPAGKMLYLNGAYHSKYLKPKGISINDYIGSYDRFVFPEDEAASFYNNDKFVIETGIPTVFMEKVNGKFIKVLKYPYRMGHTIIGVAAIEYDEFK